MAGTAQPERDVSVHSNATRMWGVKATNAEYRPWIASFPVCPALDQYHIAHVGLIEAVAPYHIVRTKQTSTYFMACYGGRGRVLIDGHWRDCRSGMACLFPPHIYNAFQAIPGIKWKFCWVCYVQPPGQRPISDAASPVLARYDHMPIHSAILGLVHECQNGGAPSLLQKWTELIHEYVLRFAKPLNADPRLRSLWERVTTQLGEKWTLQRLAREAGYSIEHLRRLCHLEVGRSPMHQVIYLRMRRAAELLTTTNEKIEAIAQAVGYQNQFTFSKAFHKWIGWQPSAYRSNRPNCPETTKSNQHLDKARTQIHHSLFTCALLFLCSALGEENRSLPIGNPEVNSPAAVRAGSMRSTPTTTPTTAQTEAAAEDRSLRSEQLRAAQELYQAFPHDPDVVYVTGYVFHEQGDYASAIRYWTEIAKPDAPKLRLYEKSDLLYNLGYTHLLREDYNQAIPLLQDSVRLNPRKPEAHYRLAHAFFLKGQFGETVRILDEANLKAPLAYRLRAMANQQLGKLSEAKHDYELALELNPELAEAYYGLAMVCARLGNKEEADEHRRKFEMLKSKADLAEREQRARFDPLAITRQSVARTHTELGRVHLLRGQILEAEKLFLRAAEIDTNNTACRFQLVMIYQQAHKNTEALRFAQEMVRAEPRNPFHHLAVGNLQARLGKHPEAEATFKKVIDLAPSNSEGYFALAQLYLQTNSRLPEALQLARRAVQLAPTPVNYYVLSRALASNGDRQTAIAAIEKACELDPTNPQLQNWKAYLQQTH